jgi:hypothetical protein
MAGAPPNGHLRHLRVARLEHRSDAVGPPAELSLDTGFVDQHTFRLVKEDGRWKICGQPF